MKDLNIEIDKAQTEVQGIRCKVKLILRLFLQDVVIDMDEDETEAIVDQAEAILRRLNRLDEHLISLQRPPTHKQEAMLKKTVLSNCKLYNGFKLRAVK